MSITLSSNGYISDTFTTTVIAPAELPVTNLFKKAEIWVNKVRNQVALITISLTRGSETRELLATPDMTVFKFVDRHMMTVREEARDYIINVEDYRTLSTPFKPEKGDRIIETIDGVTYTYEVRPFNEEPVFKYTGAYRTALRVHTKKVKEDLV